MSSRIWSAVARAWAGDPKPLGEILPERPRFLTDLTPPTAELGDPVLVRDAMSALARGFVRARALLETAVTQQPDEGRFWHALAIAAERTAEPALAEIAYARDRARRRPDGSARPRGAARPPRRLRRGARGPCAGRRWARGELEPRRDHRARGGGDDAGAARRPRARAGARGGGAGVVLLERSHGRAVAVDAAGRARRGAGPQGAFPCPDARVLRAAESAFEFDTFWDRALVVHGYARLGLTADVARVAAPLARELVAALLAEPAMKGASAREIAEPLATAAAAIDFGRPDQVAELLEPVMARDDLRHYRVPCAHCGRGSVGVERIEDDDAGAED